MARLKKENTLTPEMLADLKEATRVLCSGGVILYPTDTVWGLGCDATNEDAVKRIYEIKQRVQSKALITLVDGLAMLERTVEGIPEVAYDLIEFADRPLTVIYDKGVGVAPNLLADDGTLAVRVTRDVFSASLCRNLRGPLVSTSANISTRPTPANFNEIETEIIEAADYVCLSRRDDMTRHRSSTIMRLAADGQFKIIRP